MDNPKDIAHVTTLKIRPAACSSERGCLIYSNGRNQVPIEIEVKVTDKNNRVLKFDYGTWRHLLSLRYATSDTELTWRGKTGLCYTDEENDYTTEAHHKRSRRQADGSFIMILYVYSTSIGINRIAVRIDTEGADGIHVTTADTGSSYLKMSVTIDAIHEIVYQESDLKIMKSFQLGLKQNTLEMFNCDHQFDRKQFECHYDNYYVDVEFGIRNAHIRAHGSVEGDRKWICAYEYCTRNNQHMIVAHPFRSQNGVEGSDTFGFHNSATFDIFVPFQYVHPPYSCHCDYDLTQTVKYNEHPGKICFTQMAFETSAQWELPVKRELDIKPFSFDTYFELYDTYGNYGRFSVGFTDDHGFIKFSNR